jgi:hypothetical protein
VIVDSVKLDVVHDVHSASSRALFFEEATFQRNQATVIERIQRWWPGASWNVALPPFLLLMWLATAA